MAPNSSPDRAIVLPMARPPLALRALLALAAVRLLLHTLTNGQYGFHRDELATLADARYLDWSFPAYPALTPFLARLGLELFGAAPAGVRLLTALAQCGGMVLTGMMARELGGGRRAQVLAALAAAASPVSTIAGHLFQYVSFDYLWSVLLAWIVLRLLHTRDPRWLAAAALALGLGLNTRYTIVVVVAGLLTGLLLTPARELLFSKWLWIGAVLAAVLVAPLAAWQWRHDFLALEFTRAIHARDVAIGRTDGFLWKQFFVPAHVLTVPLWIAGLWFYFRHPAGARYRPIGWAFAVSLVLYTLAQARDYYTTPLYPMLFAAGAVLVDAWPRRVRLAQHVAVGVAILSCWALGVPAAPAGSAWFRTVTSINGDLAEEVGWPEFVAQTAAAYRSLPAAEQNTAGIFAGNYGEAGALVLYGPSHGLPEPMSRANSFWLRGYDRREPQTLVVTGVSEAFVRRHFHACEWQSRITNALGVANEETKFSQNIWVCRGLRAPWPEFWKQIRAWS